MTNMMTKVFVKSRIRVQNVIANSEAGQGTLEYVGMIIIAGLFAAGLIALAGGVDLHGKFNAALDDIFGTKR
jgi:hypothetical protein